MKGQLYIDGLDAYDQYGVTVQRDSYKSLVQFPPMKKVEFVDWPDEDGIDADLSSPSLDSQEFQLIFYASDVDKLAYLTDLLRSSTYHIFKFEDIGCTRRLRFVSHTQSKLLKSEQEITLTFADDFPLRGYSYMPPTADLYVNQDGYELDGVPFAVYGVCILRGSDAEIIKTPPVKSNLLVNLQLTPGVMHDDWRVFYQAKDVKLKCVLKASCKESFWRNYNALLYNLTQPGERRFYADCVSNIYPCYYKSAQVDKFALLNGGMIWCEFSLTLCFTSFKAELQECFLITEDEAYLITEDNLMMTIIKNS